MDQATQQLLYQRCNPEEALDPGDDRWVDLDAAQGDEPSPRGLSLVVDLGEDIRLSRSIPQCWFVSGLPGSGKSTELRRLARRLSSPQGGNLRTVVIDASEMMDLNAEIDLPDILLAVIAGVEAEALRVEQKDPRLAMVEGKGRRLLNWIARTELVPTSLDATLGAKGGLPGVGEGNAALKVALDLKDQPSLRRLFRERAGTQLARFKEDVRADLMDLLPRVCRAGEVGVVVVLDTLEKLQGTSTTWKQVLDSAERTIRHLDDDLRLPVHLVLTVPPALTQRRYAPDLRFLPMIKLWDREHRAPFASGFAVARKLIEDRIPPEHLTTLLGADLREDRIRQIIERSGGYPREIVYILRRLLIYGPRAASHFRQVLAQVDNNLRTVVNTEEAVAVLAHVCLYRDTKVREDLLPTLESLLSNNAILRYQNESCWFDVRPVLREDPAVIAAMRSIEAAKGAHGWIRREPST